MFGVVDFYLAAKKSGIKPVIGAELYLAPGHRTDRSAKNQASAYTHLLLLCKNETGYRNLCKLSSIGYLEGFHYKPRIDLESLRQYAEGLISSTGCLGGEIPQLLLREEPAKAEEALKRYLEIFGPENFFVELQDQGLPQQSRINAQLSEMARRHGLLLVATNDCHYLNKDDAEAHDALLCIQTNKTPPSGPRPWRTPKKSPICATSRFPCTNTLSRNMCLLKARQKTHFFTTW